MTRIDQALAERYGRTRSASRRNRLIYILGAAFASIMVIGWVVWAGLDQPTASLEAQDTGHSIVSDRAVDIGWQVSVASGTPVTCALQVKSIDHAVVGWKIVKLAGQKQYTTAHHSTVFSTQLPVTGLIYGCWLT